MPLKLTHCLSTMSAAILVSGLLAQVSVPSPAPVDKYWEVEDFTFTKWKELDRALGDIGRLPAEQSRRRKEEVAHAREAFGKARQALLKSLAGRASGVQSQQPLGIVVILKLYSDISFELDLERYRDEVELSRISRESESAAKTLRSGLIVATAQIRDFQAELSHDRERLFLLGTESVGEIEDANSKLRKNQTALNELTDSLHRSEEAWNGYYGAQRKDTPAISSSPNTPKTNTSPAPMTSPAPYRIVGGTWRYEAETIAISRGEIYVRNATLTAFTSVDNRLHGVFEARFARKGFILFGNKDVLRLEFVSSGPFDGKKALFPATGIPGYGTLTLEINSDSTLIATTWDLTPPEVAVGTFVLPSGSMTLTAARQ